jgi:hypothetical protein
VAKVKVNTVATVATAATKATIKVRRKERRNRTTEAATKAIHNSILNTASILHRKTTVRLLTDKEVLLHRTRASTDKINMVKASTLRRKAMASRTVSNTLHKVVHRAIHQDLELPTVNLEKVIVV